MKISGFITIILLLVACGGGSSNETVVEQSAAAPVTDDPLQKLAKAGDNVSERAATIVNKSAQTFASIRQTDGQYPSVINEPKASAAVGEGYGGIGVFYIAAYLQSGNTTYLNLAQEIADNMLADINNGELGHDWISGAVGQAEYMLLLNRIAPSNDYMGGAITVAEFLIDSAYKEGQDQVYWKHWPTNPKIYTSIAHGSSGVGQFLLHLYQQDPKQKWLDLSIKTYNWLENYWLEDGDKAGWTRLSRESFVTHSYCGGTAGILPFVYKLFEATGEARYLNKYVNALDGLMAYAENEADTLYWTVSERQQYPFSGYCLGNAGIAHQMHLGGLRTGDNRYIDAAIKGANWLIKNQNLSHQEQVGYWEHFTNSTYTMPSILYGNASVGSSLLYFYRYTQDEQYLQAVERYINWLVIHADDYQGGWVWKETYLNNQSEYHIGLLNGFSGVGILALEFQGLAGFAFLDSAEFAKNQGLP